MKSPHSTTRCSWDGCSGKNVRSTTDITRLIPTVTSLCCHCEPKSIFCMLYATSVWVSLFNQANWKATTLSFRRWGRSWPAEEPWGRQFEGGTAWVRQERVGLLVLLRNPALPGRLWEEEQQEEGRLAGDLLHWRRLVPGGHPIERRARVTVAFQLTKKFKSSGTKNERSLHHTLSKNFLPELPRLFKEKERQARRRLLENQPRRTSDRIRKLVKLLIDPHRPAIIAFLLFSRMLTWRKKIPQSSYIR